MSDILKTIKEAIEEARYNFARSTREKNLRKMSHKDSIKTPMRVGMSKKEMEASYKDDPKYKQHLAKMKAEEYELEEAKRGRPKASGEESEGDREHIIVQYRKAERIPGKKIEHADKSSHEFPKEHYRKALDMHVKMKPAEKETFEKELDASPERAKNAVAGKPAPKAAPKISLGSMKKESYEINEQIMAEEILLNKLYENLSETNQKIFEEMIETQDGLDSLLEFAHKQGL